MEHRRLYKSETDKKIFGVCGGVAEYFGWDPTIVRVATAILAMAYGSGFLLYCIAAFVMPTKSQTN